MSPERASRRRWGRLDTSIARRLRERVDAEVVRAATTEHATAAQHADRAPDRIKPIAGLLQHPLHSISTEQYIERVAWSAAVARLGKHHLQSPSAALQAIGCDAAQWTQQMAALRCGWRVVGGSATMRELAQCIGQHRFKRRTRADRAKEHRKLTAGR
jgi:hypothetical protein